MLSLKKEIDLYTRNNEQFGKENKLLSNENEKLFAANQNLQNASNSIKQSIKKQQINLDKLSQLNKNLAATGKRNFELLSDLNQMADKMESHWKEEIIQKERKILNVCFDRFDWEDGNDGISQSQYNEFKQTLPIEFQFRLSKAGDFKDFAGNDDIMQLDEFIKVLDKFTQELDINTHFNMQ